MILVGAALVLLALVGAPLFVIIAASALFAYDRADIPLSALPIEIFRLGESPVLVAIPLFTFAGYVLGESGAPRRLVRLTDAVLGWMPGGLAVVALATCGLFTAFTGASGVTIIALGALLYPALVEAGYSERFTLGLVTTSGSLGLLFAPSLPLILYGVVVQQVGSGPPVSIEELFRAGVLPGILMVVLLAGWSFWANRGGRARAHERRRGGREVGAALLESIWEIPLPFLVLGGIYSGFFAVSEAAAVTAVYVVVVEVFVLREIRIRDLGKIVRESMLLVGGILIILGVSIPSTTAMIDSGLPGRLVELVEGRVTSQLTFLLLLNLFLLALGAILDIFSALVLVVPLLLPVATSYGIHPAHLGIIFLANMQIGYLTPPVGLNLFISSYRFEKPIVEVYRATWPFLVVLLASVLVITYWPWLSLVLLGS